MDTNKKYTHNGRLNLVYICIAFQLWPTRNYFLLNIMSISKTS